MRRLFGFKKGPTEEKAAGEGVSGSESPEPSSKGVVQRHLNYYEDLGAATVGESQERRQGSSNSGRKQGEVQRQVAFLNPPVSADVSSPILKPGKLQDLTLKSQDIRMLIPCPSFVSPGFCLVVSTTTAHSTESNHGNSTACCKTSSNTGAAHIEPSLTSPPLNKSRDSPSQNSSRVPSAPFPSYGPASGANARSWTPANQAIPDSMHRAISPLSTSTVTSRPYFSRNLHPLDRSLVSRNSSSTTQLNPPTTWSELADPDLVDNLGGRERTRQEVLYEIVASEERYVCVLVTD